MLLSFKQHAWWRLSVSDVLCKGRTKRLKVQPNPQHNQTLSEMCEFFRFTPSNTTECILCKMIKRIKAALHQLIKPKYPCWSLVTQHSTWVLIRVNCWHHIPTFLLSCIQVFQHHSIKSVASFKQNVSGYNTRRCMLQKTSKAFWKVQTLLLNQRYISFLQEVRVSVIRFSVMWISV